MVSSDNGTELTTNAILHWQEERALIGTTLRRTSPNAERPGGELQ